MTLDGLLFITGVELPDRTLLIAARDADADMDEDPHTLILQRSPDGQWTEPGHVEWASIAVCGNGPDNGMGLLGRYGKFLEFRQDGHTRADVISDVDEEDPPTVFRFLKSINGQLYAGGTDRYLYRFISGRWTEIGPEDMKCVGEIGSIENLTGFGTQELYGVGWSGEIWTNAHGAWRQIESPTNIILNDADVFNGDVYIGGLVGTILKGRGDSWGIIDHDILEQDIWSVRAFGNAVYFSAISGIMKLEDGTMTLFKTLGPDMRTAMSLFTGPSGLWSVGASDIVLFDGDQWHTIAQSD